jgi:[ribosomal protein S5]-alanine N-acetyltransferase
VRGAAGRATPELEQLHAHHAPAVLAFELVNRAYFAASISDRGDEFFDQFPDRHTALLAIGSRSRSPAAVWAATSHDNAASQKVLAKAGFVPVGPATPADLGGKSGTWYQRDLQP